MHELGYTFNKFANLAKFSVVGCLNQVESLSGSLTDHKHIVQCIMNKLFKSLISPSALIHF